MKACTVQQLLRSAPWWSHLAPSSILPDWSPEIVQPAFGNSTLLFDASSKSEVRSARSETGSLPCVLFAHKDRLPSCSQGHRSVFPNRQPNKKSIHKPSLTIAHGSSEKEQTMGGWFVQKNYTISHCESFWSTCFASKKKRKKKQ